jgi:GNAT superfamily N-acetyltransferase
VVDERGVAVGTISAWYNRDFKGGEWGQLHWVALRRAYQGKGLARPMLSHALTQMAQWHERAFLGTSTSTAARHQTLPGLRLRSRPGRCRRGGGMAHGGGAVETSGAGGFGVIMEV